MGISKLVKSRGKLPSRLYGPTLASARSEFSRDAEVNCGRDEHNPAVNSCSNDQFLRVGWNELNERRVDSTFTIFVYLKIKPPKIFSSPTASMSVSALPTNALTQAVHQLICAPDFIANNAHLSPAERLALHRVPPVWPACPVFSPYASTHDGYSQSQAKTPPGIPAAILQCANCLQSGSMGRSTSPTESPTRRSAATYRRAWTSAMSSTLAAGPPSKPRAPPGSSWHCYGALTVPVGTSTPAIWSRSQMTSTNPGSSASCSWRRRSGGGMWD